MLQHLALAGLILAVALAVPSTMHQPLSSLPATFDRRDLATAHHAITHALSDLIPEYNKAYREISVDRQHGLADKRAIPREETENGKATAWCTELKVYPVEVPISAKCYVMYDDLYFGFDENPNDSETSINVQKRVEQRYREGSTLSENLAQQTCSVTRGPYDSLDRPGDCCYIHWSWLQTMLYDDRIYDYRFPDPYSTSRPGSDSQAYVVCFDVVGSASCSSAALSHRSGCTFQHIEWNRNVPPPPPVATPVVMMG